ncbi:hypothetical protein HELRODRAFT_155500 [Helobdella robusta]|uniref:Uncharacterized protein n=1 Tax=Helobdella robusta TaxID=6412 RepID=T1ELI6_HELRO|nr:hypothetical protein HELRODRAFT_155500 [Helobdella robusta]ESO10424.1 hypothetical protein HELRODRAFT_155500 [Helobdella robusta]
MSADAYITFEWNDVQLTWDPSKYGGINKINLPFYKVWEPEIILYDNRAVTGQLVDSRQVSVSSDGRVEWTPQLRMEVYCTSNYRAFPYDEQVCQFFFMSHLYERSYVKLLLQGKEEPMSRDACTSVHNEWEVIRCTPYIETMVYTHGNEHDWLGLIVSVRRKYVYHVYVLIVPTVIIVFLILSIFWIPHYSNQRFSFAGGMLFVLLLMNFLVQEFLPVGLGNVPRVVSYTLYALLLLSLTTILSLATHYLYFTDPKHKPVPEFLKTIFFRDVIAMITGVSADVIIASDPISSSFDNKSWATANKSTSLIAEQNGTGNEVSGVTEKLLEEIHKNLDALTSGQKSRVLDNEWKQLSMIFDRLLFYFFLLVNIVVTSVLYGQSFARNDVDDVKALNKFFEDYDNY